MTDTKDKTPAASTQEERDQRATEQNLPEGAVPEQRPQASQVNEGLPHSELTQKLKEAGDPNVGVDEPMDQAAYDKAASDAQAKKAEKESKTEGVMVGNRAIATKGPHEGRIFAVTRIVSEGSVGDAVRRLSGSPEQVLNRPKEVEVTAIGDERDGERLILDAEENGLEKLNEGWAGSRAGRRH